jgi:hypothetical protein
MKMGGGNVSIVKADCRDYGQTEVRMGRKTSLPSLKLQLTTIFAFFLYHRSIPSSHLLQDPSEPNSVTLKVESGCSSETSERTQETVT